MTVRECELLVPLRRWGSLNDFYAGVLAREQSGEMDFGCWWLGGNLGRTQYRVTAVRDTSEFYVVRLGRGTRDEPAGEVFLAGRFVGGNYESAEAILEGWAEVCGSEGSLVWALERLVPTLEAGRERIADPGYAPTVGEALTDPAAFVDGFEERRG